MKLKRSELRKYADDIEYQRRIIKYKDKAIKPNREGLRKADPTGDITLNEVIGMIQNSYAAALNKSKDWTGSLFQNDTKAKDGWIDEFVTLKKNGKDNFLFKTGNDYSYHCLNYIHNNPVEAKLVSNPVDYPWSSAPDYAGLRKGTLCNLKLGRKILTEI